MELEKCPFCKDGGSPNLISVSSEYASGDKAIADAWAIKCNACGIRTPAFYDKIFRTCFGELVVEENGVKKAIDFWHRWCSDAGQDD